MAQLDPLNFEKILRNFLPAANATSKAIQDITSEINKALTASENATQRIFKSLSYSDDLVQNMAKNYIKIKNAVNGTKLGELALDRKIMDDFADRFTDAQTKIIKLKDQVINTYDKLKEKESIYLQLRTAASEQEFNRIKRAYEWKLKALNQYVQEAEMIQNQADAYVDLKQKQKIFNQALENKSGFSAFESSLGIFGKIPTVARSLEQLSLRTKIIIGAIFTIFKTAYDALDEIQTALLKTVKSLGVFKDDFESINTFIKDTTIDFAKFGVTAEDASVTIGSMVESFGSFTLFNEKAAKDMTLISKQLGVGNKELVEGVMTLMSFGKIDIAKSTKVVYFASALSKAAGVPLAKVMEDVAKAGDKARGMIQGGAEQLVKAAVYARRLGTDLEKVAEIGRKMLDFQESITDEIEASVLFGSNISFQKARELFYTGKIQEGYDEIFKVVKSIGDFNKLDIFQKEAIAKATGLSLTDLQKQVQIREDLSALEISGTEKQKEMVREYRKLTEQSGSMLENTAAAQEQRVKELINLKQTEEITARIRGLFLSISSHVLPIIEGTLKGINLLLEVLDTTLGKIFLAGGALYLAIGSFKKIKALYFDLRGVFVAIRGASAAVTSQLAIQTAATKTAAVSQTILNNTASAPVGKGGFMSSLMSIDYKTLLSLSVVMISFAGALYILAKAGQEFNSVDWESMGKLGTAAVGLTALTLAIVGLSTVIDASFEVILPAAAIIGVLALAMLGLGKAAQLVGQGTKNFGEGLKFAVDALKDFGQNVSIIDSAKLTGLFSAINSSIRDFDLSRLQSIVSAMQSLAASLNSISAFKGIPQLTLPTNAVNTTNVPTVLTNTPVISPVQTNVQTNNASTTNSTAMIDAVKQGIKEGMNNISLNVYLDGQKMVTGLSKNVGFRQDTGGIAMQSSLT
jgi:hypothetical protein